MEELAADFREAGSGLPATADIEIEVGPVGGTPVSFSQLYDQQFQPLVRLAALMIGRPEAARDVVQDAFVRLHVRWSTVRNPGAYVRRSVINGCKSYFRREGLRRRELERLATTPVAPMNDFDHTVASLAGLTHRQRAVVILKYYDDRSEREIADIIGCRPGSVGPTLQRALAVLRSEDQGDMP